MKSTHLHFKRYRMEVDLARPPTALAAAPALPAGFHWLPWRDNLLFAHAEVKALCFQDETDALVFRSLGSLDGCRELMAAIRDRPGFCPHATWLVVAAEMDEAGARTGLAGNCVATVQGVLDERGHGAIQNVGVVPEFRGLGLGRALMLKAIAGFVACRARRAWLEVTASNRHAMRMYRDLGFRCTKTLYRSVPIPEPVAIGL